MDFLTHPIVYILGGLVLLVVGGDFLVRGASELAKLANISPMVVGLTVVAAGTSAPELVVAIDASLRGSPDLATGNVIGSNIFNIAAILGVASLITPLHIQGNTVRLEWPILMVATLLFFVLGRDLMLDRTEGILFAICFLAFLGYTIFIARHGASSVEHAQFVEHQDEPKPTKGTARLRVAIFEIARASLGCMGLVFGAEFLVDGATTVARTFNVSESTIGLTVVAAGTSLPELATSAVAAWRKKNDIAVANVIGSSIMNILGILGFTAMVSPIPLGSALIEKDLIWLLAITALLFPIMFTGRRINRFEGVILLGIFGAYLWALLQRSS